MSPLESIRRRRGLTQAQLAEELELGSKSKGYISRLENGRQEIGLRLALRIERWSGGELRAADICPEARGLAAVDAASA